MMKLKDYNNLDKTAAAKELFACCGSQKWADEVMSNFPFESEKSLVAKATDAWYDTCTKEDWLESFTHHPEIGDVTSLKEKFAGKEQAGVAIATNETIEALAKANADYKSKFGFIFIVCATGKSADEMLRIMQDRLKNSAEEELNIAMGEQMKITIIRLKKLLPESDWSFLKVSQITTHILDTTIGKPGKDITIKMQKIVDGKWQTMCQGITNNDGRIADLLAPNKTLAAGNYKMVFDTAGYFAQQKTTGFYPEVEIQFTVFDNTHYHVPLLINPFGYSTYRGS